MQLKKIKVGRWYETERGIGRVTQVGGCHPPAVRMRIVYPFPRGTQFLKPRQVTREIPEADLPFTPPEEEV